MASYANVTTPGSYVSQGTKSITDLMNKYKDNETIAGLGAGTLFDIGRTQANTGMAVAYNDAFLGSLGNYQKGLEDLKFSNTSRLMAQEGAITRDLTDMTTGRQLEGTKYLADQNLAGTKYGYDSQERQIGIQGREDRLTAAAKTTEEKRLRADARQAVRSQGARFYG